MQHKAQTATRVLFTTLIFAGGIGLARASLRPGGAETESLPAPIATSESQYAGYSNAACVAGFASLPNMNLGEDALEQCEDGLVEGFEAHGGITDPAQDGPNENPSSTFRVANRAVVNMQKGGTLRSDQGGPALQAIANGIKQVREAEEIEAKRKEFPKPTSAELLKPTVLYSNASF